MWRTEIRFALKTLILALFLTAVLVFNRADAATITTIQASDNLSTWRLLINANFANLNNDRISTSSLPTVGALSYWTGLKTQGSVATGTVSGSNGITVTAGQSIIGSGLTITGTNAAADGSTKGVASFTANDFDCTSGDCSLDYTNGQKASGSQHGFLSSTDWTTFNSKLSAADPFTHTTNFGANASATGTPTWFQGGVQASSTSQLGTASSTAFSAASLYSSSLTSGNCVQAGTDGLLVTVAAPCAGGTQFGQAFEIDSAGWLSPTSTNRGVNTSAQGITYGYGLADQLLGYASSTNAVTTFGLGAGGQSATTSATISGNTAIGFNAGWNLTSGRFNTLVGRLAGGTLSTTDNNTAVGYLALQTTSGSDNTGVGQSAGTGGSGSRNVSIGKQAGSNTGSGSGNISIGSYADSQAAGGSAGLNIGNLLYGTGLYNTALLSRAPVIAGTVGVASSSPFAAFSVHAPDRATNRTLFAIGSSTAAATTTLFSIDNTGIASTTNFINSGVPNALWLANSTGLATAYGGTPCTNQFIRSLNGAGVATCASTDDPFTHAIAGTSATSTPLMVLASTTIGNGTPTGGLTVSGTATSTNFVLASVSSAGCATFSVNGLLSSTGASCGGSGIHDPFSHTTNFGANTSATSSPVWFQSGAQASSTSQFDFASTTALTATRAATIGTTTQNTSRGIGLGIGTTTAFGSQVVGYPASSTCSTTCAPDWNTGNKQTFYLTGNVNIVMNSTSSNPIDGGVYMLRLCQDGTGSRTATFVTPGQLRWPTLGATPGATTTISSAANSCSMIGFLYDGNRGIYSSMGSTTGVSRL